MYSNYQLEDFLNVDVESINLSYMYRRLNELVFNSELPKMILITWNNRLTRVAGRAWSSYKGRGERIEISYKYHSKYPCELLDTVVHEMTHLYYPNEGHNKI